MVAYKCRYPFNIKANLKKYMALANMIWGKGSPRWGGGSASCQCKMRLWQPKPFEYLSYATCTWLCHWPVLMFSTVADNARRHRVGRLDSLANYDINTHNFSVWVILIVLTWSTFHQCRISRVKLVYGCYMNRIRTIWTNALRTHPRHSRYDPSYTLCSQLQH